MTTTSTRRIQKIKIKLKTLEIPIEFALLFLSLGVNTVTLLVFKMKKLLLILILLLLLLSCPQSWQGRSCSSVVKVYRNILWCGRNQKKSVRRPTTSLAWTQICINKEKPIYEKVKPRKWRQRRGTSSIPQYIHKIMRPWWLMKIILNYFTEKTHRKKQEERERKTCTRNCNV